MEMFLTVAERKPADDTTTNSTSVNKPKSGKYCESYLSLGYTDVFQQQLILINMLLPFLLLRHFHLTMSKCMLVIVI